MLLSTVMLPLISFISVSLFARYIGAIGTRLVILSNALLIISLVFLVYFSQILLANDIFTISLFNWMHTSTFSVMMSFLFDNISFSMLSMISLVSSVILAYSCNYMGGDPHYVRFMTYLVLFIFFMFILISASSLIQLFIGWEGVGICSYLLINFWFLRIAANKAALKALLVNRIGDIGFLFGAILVIKYINSLDFVTLLSLSSYFNEITLLFSSTELTFLSIAAIFLLVGAIGKSAQIGLHTWLPSAMEGPTPVSALIHAATMVTAGIFLIIRTSYLFEFSGNVLSFMVMIGSVTAFFAALTALLQTDVKKVIAYSTCSQLGYMILACGLSQYSTSLFHLINHAFFKALLFLAAGMIIHAMSDEQDSRQMNGLAFLLPITSLYMAIGGIALSSVPFFSGFYSKDLIIELSYLQSSPSSNFAYNCAIIGAIITYLYSNKLGSVFENIYVGFRVVLGKVSEQVSNYMVIPLIALAIGSILLGFMARDFFVGLGNNLFTNTMYIHEAHYSLAQVEYLPFVTQVLPTVLTIIPIYLLVAPKNVTATMVTYADKYLSKTAINLFYFDKLQNALSWNIMKSSYNYLLKLVDKGLIEVLGPTGLVNFGTKIALSVNNMKSRLLNNYLLLMIFSGILLFVNLIASNIFGMAEICPPPSTNSTSDEPQTCKPGQVCPMPSKVEELIPCTSAANEQCMNPAWCDFQSMEFTANWFWSSVMTKPGFSYFRIPSFSPYFRDINMFETSYLWFGLILAVISVISFSAIFATLDRKEYAVFFFILGVVTNIFLLFLAGFEFLGLLFLIVYAGAIAVLFLFVLMMVPYAHQVQLVFNTWQNKLATLIIVGFSVLLFVVKFDNVILPMAGNLIYHYNIGITMNDLWFALEIKGLSNLLFNSYYPFIIVTTLVLFIAMLSAIEITQSHIVIFGFGNNKDKETGKRVKYKSFTLPVTTRRGIVLWTLYGFAFQLLLVLLYKLLCWLIFGQPMQMDTYIYMDVMMMLIYGYLTRRHMFSMLRAGISFFKYNHDRLHWFLTGMTIHNCIFVLVTMFGMSGLIHSMCPADFARAVSAVIVVVITVTYNFGLDVLFILWCCKTFGWTHENSIKVNLVNFLFTIAVFVLTVVIAFEVIDFIAPYIATIIDSGSSPVYYAKRFFHYFYGDWILEWFGYNETKIKTNNPYIRVPKGWTPKS